MRDYIRTRADNQRGYGAHKNFAASTYRSADQHCKPLLIYMYERRYTEFPVCSARSAAARASTEAGIPARAATFKPCD